MRRRHAEVQTIAVHVAFHYAVDPVEDPTIDPRGEPRRPRLDDVRRAEAGDQLGGRAERDRAAVVDDHHAVAELRRLFHVVRGQHDGAAVLVAVRADHVPQRASRLGIESRRRLVEEQQLGSPGERGRHREALPLSARKVRVAGVGLLLELHERDQLLDRPTRLVEPGEQRAELGDGLLLEQPRVLERHADTRADLLRVAPPVQPQHLDDAFGRVEQAFADLHGGRLARTVRAEQPEDLAALDRQVQPVDRDDRRAPARRVDLAEPRESDRRTAPAVRCAAHRGNASATPASTGSAAPVVRVACTKNTTARPTSAGRTLRPSRLRSR